MDSRPDPRIYMHVRHSMVGRIRGGEFPAGAKLSTVPTLVAEYGCVCRSIIGLRGLICGYAAW